MNKKFIVDKIFTETLVNEITKMPYTIYKPIDREGKLFSDYIKEVPDEKFYIMYDSKSHRIIASCLYDITALPVMVDPKLNLVFTWIDVPESGYIVPFNRKDEKITINDIAGHTAGNIFISDQTDDFFHLNRFEYLNEFDQIILDIDLLKNDISFTIDNSIDNAEYVGFKFTHNDNKYLQPYRMNDITNLKLLIDLPAFTNDDIKLYKDLDIYKRESSNYDVSSMSDDELTELLTRMVKLNMSRKVIRRAVEDYIDTFTDGKELYKTLNCRINEFNTLVTDLDKYILDTIVNI